MKRLLFALCFLPSIAFGAAIDFRNLNTNHFTTNGFRVGLKSIPTNQTIAQFVTNAFNGLVGTGTVTTTIATNIVSGMLTNGNLLYVDMIVGSDTLGRRWNFAWPFRTPLGAKNAASARDTIQVRPGRYTNNALLKDQVHWDWLAGSECHWQPLADDTTNAYAMFDDRVTGACTSNITGDGRFFYTGNVDALTYSLGPRGVVYVQNINSGIRFKALEAQFTDASGAANTIPAIFYIEACNYFFLDVEDLYDPNTNGLSFCSGVYWERGNVFCNVRRNRATFNALYGQDPSTNNTSYSLYYRGDYAETTGIDSGAIYLAGNVTNTNYRMWCDILEIKSTRGPAVAWVTGGKFYVNFQKASSEGGGSPCVWASGKGDGWVTGQKITSVSNACISMGPTTTYEGKAVIRVDELDDGGQMPNFITVNSGLLVIQGPTYCRAISASARGLVQTGGTSRIDSITFDMRALAKTTNHPAHMAGGAMLLRDATLLAPTTTTNAIFAPSAQTVKIYGSLLANTNLHPNVTVPFGIVEVNGGAQ